MGRSRAQPLRRRSPREWPLRGALAVGAVTLGWVSGGGALERLHFPAPGDGHISAKLALQMWTDAPSAAQRARASALAAQALVDEPLAVPALTTLAIDAQARGDSALARRLFIHSDAVSRRDLGTRLWLIEDAIGREDIPGALKHYDIALRTSNRAPPILFPLLSGAISDPAIARPLTDMLVTRPDWGDAFIRQLGSAEVDPLSAASFLRTLSARGIAVPATTSASVVNRLVAAGSIDPAWSYYRGLRGGTTARDGLRDPDFSAQPEARTAFDWNPVQGGAGVTASIQPADDGGMFDFGVPPTIGATVLEQRLLLSPGEYRIDGVSSNIDQPAQSRPYWQLMCADRRSFGTVPLSNSPESDQRFTGRFVVGDNCPSQILRLVARPSSNISGVSGQIKRVTLARIASQS